ncbi:mercury methylation corrinoid protein HgcA [Candidatus Bipolaricaulota bacterium]
MSNEQGGPASRILTTTSRMTAANRWDHFLARLGVRRNDHRVSPGLYLLGNPKPDSSVFVTANYSLSFDALRTSLQGVDAYILVLDTKGINVWCAAGKGTFGTDELLKRIEVTGLADVVQHRTLILPQLGAPGVVAYEVRRRSGFNVEYGPVRAADLPEYLEEHQATPEMRQVQFPFLDRLVLVPIEFVHILWAMAVVGVGLYFIGGLWSAGAGVAALLAGSALFPVLLPWIPTRDFSSKGFILGGLVTLPFALVHAFRGSGATDLQSIIAAVGFMLLWPPVTAFLALNFTGATTFTSRTGVRREMSTYIRPMAVSFVVGIALSLIVPFILR